MRWLVLLGMMVAMGCGETTSGLAPEEHAGDKEVADAPWESKGTCSGSLGDSSYCGEGCPCGEGEGDCDSDAECQSGLVCARDVGAHYGWSSGTDVCQSPCTRVGDGEFNCTPECPCVDGEGDCDGDEDCEDGARCLFNVGVAYGYWDPEADVCVAGCPAVGVGRMGFCAPGCPCSAGEGDCDSDADCEAGLECIHDVGLEYGFDGEVDVCQTGATPAPGVHIVFPPPQGLTTNATITVRGTAHDADGVAAVRVGGVTASSSNGFAEWSAVVPLAQGANTLVAEIEDSLGNIDTSAEVVVTRRGGALIDPVSLAWDAENERVLVMSPITAKLFAVDPATGETSLVYDDGYEPTLALGGSHGKAAWDLEGQRVFLAYEEDNVVVSVDLVTGARTIVADADTGAGPALQSPSDILFDGVNNRLLVADSDLDALLAIDLLSGQRAVVSSPSVGAGDSMYNPEGIVLDPSGERVFVGDYSKIMAVDLGTGDRTVVASRDVGAGPLFHIPDIAWDAVNERLITVNLRGDKLMAVDVDTGDRTILAGSGVGTGPALAYAWSVATDPAGNRAFVAEAAIDGVVVVDLATGDRTAIADLAVGTGQRMRSAHGAIAWDPVNGRALVAIAYAMVSVDLATGDRSDLFTVGSPISVAWDARYHRAVAVDLRIRGLRGIDVVTGAFSTINANTSPTNPQSVSWDPLNKRALLTDVGRDMLYEVDVDTGIMTTVAGDLVGTGPGLEVPRDSAWDPIHNRALVADMWIPGLFSVDTATGDRFLLSDMGTGPSLASPQGVTWDPVESRALVADPVNHVIVGVDTTTGDRALVHDFTSGGGPLVVAPYSVLPLGAGHYHLVLASNLEALVAADPVSGEWVIVSH